MDFNRNTDRTAFNVYHARARHRITLFQFFHGVHTQRERQIESWLNEFYVVWQSKLFGYRKQHQKTIEEREKSVSAQWEAEMNVKGIDWPSIGDRVYFSIKYTRFRMYVITRSLICQILQHNSIQYFDWLNICFLLHRCHRRRSFDCFYFDW